MAIQTIQIICAKVMKKIAVFMAIVLSTGSISSCSPAKDADNVFELPAEEVGATGEQSYNEKEQTEESEAHMIADTAAYSFGNMQINAPAGNYMDFGDKVLFTRLKESKPGTRTGAFYLYVMDKESGEVSTFCKDASCPHTALECYAGNVVGNVEQYNGEIYAINQESEIMELREGKFQKAVNGQVYGFWHAGGSLYAVSRDCSLVVFEDAKRLPRILVDEYRDYGSVVFGNFVYGHSTEGVSRVDLTAEQPQREIVLDRGGFSLIDGQYIYYYDLKDGYLYRCDMEGENTELLLKQWTNGLNFDEEYLYFTMCAERNSAPGERDDRHDLYRMSKANPNRIELLTSIEEAQIVGVYTVPGYEKLFVETSRKVEEKGAFYQLDELYLVSKVNGEAILVQMPEY